MPLRIWGCLFLGMGLMVWTASTFVRNVMLLKLVVLFTGSLGWLLWGIMSAAAAFHTGKTSFSGAFLVFLVLWVHAMVVRRGE